MPADAATRQRQDEVHRLEMTLMGIEQVRHHCPRTVGLHVY
jgi:hypothetical protein